MDYKKYSEMQDAIVVLGVNYQENLRVLMEEMLDQIRENENDIADIKDQVERLSAAKETPVAA